MIGVLGSSLDLLCYSIKIKKQYEVPTTQRLTWILSGLYGARSLSPTVYYVLCYASRLVKKTLQKKP
jgi:hypothetical protein